MGMFGVCLSTHGGDCGGSEAFTHLEKLGDDVGDGSGHPIVPR